VDPEAVVQKWIASCTNASLNDLRTRGEYIGSEMSILSLRLLRNLICHHSKTCKKIRKRRTCSYTIDYSIIVFG